MIAGNLFDRINKKLNVFIKLIIIIIIIHTITIEILFSMYYINIVQSTI